MSAKQFSKTDNYSFINNNNAHGTDSNIKPYPVVVYNRIPKTGSTSLINLVYQLIEENYSHTHVIHLNISSNKHYLNRVNELYLIDNLTHWTSMHPLIIHGHFAYINFIKYGSLFNPIYINMIRNPLDRLVSYYYFLRYGDDYRPYLIRKRMFDIVTRNQTFDECVLVNGSDCSPQLLWVQVSKQILFLNVKKTFKIISVINYNPKEAVISFLGKILKLLTFQSLKLFQDI